MSTTHTPTPRTNGAIVNTSAGAAWVKPAFARQLERELAAANERIRRLEEAGDELWKASGSFVVREVDDLNGEDPIPVDSIGEDYEITPESPPTAGEHVRLDRALEQWTKAKEAKP